MISQRMVSIRGVSPLSLKKGPFLLFICVFSARLKEVGRGFRPELIGALIILLQERSTWPDVFPIKISTFN
jgi:hypothetical protein